MLRHYRPVTKLQATTQEGAMEEGLIGLKPEARPGMHRPLQQFAAYFAM